MHPLFLKAPECIEKILACLADIGYNIEAFEIDHIGYRCASTEEAEEIQNIFEGEGVFISETIVSNRKVLIFKLQEPFIYSGHSIPCVELLYPKVGKLWSGWDHIEIVLPEYTPDMHVFKMRFQNLFPLLSSGNFLYTESMHTFGDTPSPTISISFSKGSLVRFHSVDVLSLS